MSDDYFSNDNDDEYWDDLYYEKHMNEFGPGHGSGGIWEIIVLIFGIVFGISVMMEAPLMGIMIIILAIVFKK